MTLRIFLSLLATIEGYDFGEWLATEALACSLTGYFSKIANWIQLGT